MKYEYLVLRHRSEMQSDGNVALARGCTNSIREAKALAKHWNRVIELYRCYDDRSSEHYGNVMPWGEVRRA
jgi:hypothetical protein